jgi:predicted lipoprotein with Yx(FWY)xxD motif
MNRMMFAAAALAAAFSAGLANAQPAPSGVHTANGALADAADHPLYTFNFDTMKGMSHCTGPCAKAWPPFLAPADAAPAGDWTIIVREDGSRQWAYKDKPLYTFSKDQPGKPGTGGAAQNWKLAQ